MNTLTLLAEATNHSKDMIEGGIAIIIFGLIALFGFSLLNKIL